MKKSFLVVLLAILALSLFVACGSDPFFHNVTVKNGDTIIETEVVYDNSEYRLPNAPDTRGHVFDGWTAGSKTYKAGDSVKVVGDIVFEAAWGEAIAKPDVSGVDQTKLYECTDSITLTSPEGTTVRWTVDKSEPSATTGKEGKIELTGTSGVVTIKVIVVKKGYCSETETLKLKVKPTIGFDVEKDPIVSIDPKKALKITVPEGTSVYYTTDGTTEPTTDSTPYNPETGISLKDFVGNTTIKVLAVKDEVEAKDEITVDVKIAGPKGDAKEDTTYDQDDVIKFENIPEDCVVRYTFDGTDPTTSSPAVDSTGEIPLEGQSGEIEIKTAYFKNNICFSGVEETVIKIKPKKPEYTGDTTTAYEVTENLPFVLPEATDLYYTTDGKDPTIETGIKAEDGKIPLKDLCGEIDVKVIQVKDNIPSDFNTIKIKVKPTVTFDVEPDTTHGKDEAIRITVPTDVTVYYTTDGTDPTTGSTPYNPETGIPLEDFIGDTTIKVLAVKDKVETTKDLTIKVKPNAPTSDADETKIYLQTENIKVTIPDGATGYYTFDGNDPTTSSSAVPTSGEIPLDGQYGEVKAKVIAVKDGAESLVKEINIKVKPKKPEYVGDKTSVYGEDDTINPTTQLGTELYYTTDGEDPTVETGIKAKDGKSVALTGTLGEEIKKTVTIRVIAVKDGIASEVLSFDADVRKKYTITYDLDGGAVATGVKTSTTFISGAKATLISATKDGYALDGWYTKKANGDYDKYYGTGDEEITISDTQNLTLYAHWVEDTAKYVLMDEKYGVGSVKDGSAYAVTSNDKTGKHVNVSSFYHGKPVTDIGNFSDSGLETISIPDSVTTIDYSAFFNLKTLKEIVLPSSVTTIGSSAFSRSNITSLTLPDGIKVIGNCAFSYSSLETINLPEGLEKIDDYAFDTTNVTDIVIPSTVTYLGSNAFQECPKLETVEIKGSADLQYSCFYLCKALTSLKITGAVKVIGDTSVYGCINLTTVELPATLEKIERQAFRDCALTEIVIPEKVTSIYADSQGVYNAFYGCNKLTIIYVNQRETADNSLAKDKSWVPSGVPVEWKKDYKITYLDSDGTTKLGQKWIDAGESITLLAPAAKAGYALDGWYTKKANGDYDKYYGTGDEEITISDTQDITLYAHFVDENLDLETAGSAKIKEDKKSTVTSVTIPAIYHGEIITTLPTSAFHSCKLLTSVSFEGAENITEIGNNAFTYCEKLPSIDLSSTKITKLDSGLFYGCTELSSVTMPTTVGAISDAVFRECTKLKTINLPANLKSLGAFSGSQVFEGCGIETIEIPGSITSIHEECFYLSNVKTIIIDRNKADSTDLASKAPWQGAGSNAISVVWKDSHKVTLNANYSGSTDTFVYVDYNLAFAKPKDPSREGYSFDKWTTDSAGETEYTFGTTLSEDLTLYAQWTKAYQLGEKGPAGGIIIYANPNYDASSSTNNWKYLEAAPADVSSGTGVFMWDSSGGNYSTLVPDQSIGSGKSNTDKILKSAGIFRAAVACDNYSTTVDGVVYDDWFLPSIGELALMDDYRDKLGLDTLVLNYWSSSDSALEYALTYSFKDHCQYGKLKNEGHRVRPVRMVVVNK